MATESKICISYARNGRNESHIIALLIKIQDLVQNEAHGNYTEHWEELHNCRKASITIDLPNEKFEDVIDGLFDDIKNLIEEDKCRREVQSSITTRTDSEADSDELHTETKDVKNNFKEKSDSEESWKPSRSDEESKEEPEPSKKRKSEETIDGQPKKKVKVLKGKKQSLREENGGKEEKDVEKHVGEGSNTISTQARRKLTCPLRSCRSNVVHLPRHMRNVHKWTKEAAAKVLLKYNIRKNQQAKPTNKDYHRRRRCPVSKCHSIVLRLPVHLRKVHNMKYHSKEYSEALASATFVSKKKHPAILWKEERDQISTPPEMMLVNVQKEKNDDGHTSQSESESLGERKSCSNKVTAHPLFIKFEEWLKSPDGGKRDSKTVSQHSAQLVNMLNAIDDTGEIESLLDIGLVRSAFLNTHVNAKKYEAGTIKSYLMSLRHFFSFLLAENPDEVNFNVEEVTSSREKVRLWSTSYKRDSCTRRWMKLEEDVFNRLTPASIREFEKSEAAREAVKLIGKISDPSNAPLVTQMAYTLVRDFLFAQIFIDNANRPGVLSSMTLNEFYNMRKEGDDYLIAVKADKTVHIHGAAYIVLSKRLKAWLTIFVQYMRFKVTTSTTGPVFLSWNGQSMTSGQINKAVQSVFKKAKISTKVTSTSFRKAAVTQMHETNPELSGKLAGLMAHNEATAKKYYLLSEKSKASVEASKKLAKLMRDQDSATSPLKSNTSESGSSEKKELGRKRMPWTPEDLEKVQETFREEIEQHTITLDVVRNKVGTNKQLQGMSPRRIYDKLKKSLNQQSLNAKSNVTVDPPKECESLHDKIERIAACSTENKSVTHGGHSSVSIISPTERSTGIFSDEEVITIKEMFSDMILGKPISKAEIENRCSKTVEGKPLLHNLSVFQLVNRIKYERKKKRSENQ